MVLIPLTDSRLGVLWVRENYEAKKYTNVLYNTLEMLYSNRHSNKTSMNWNEWTEWETDASIRSYLCCTNEHEVYKWAMHGPYGRPQFYAGSVELAVKWQLKQRGLHNLRGPSGHEFYEAWRKLRTSVVM